jgi:chromosomal replication initiation ATPase DnaA
MEEKIKVVISPYAYVGLRIADLPPNIRKTIRMKTRRYTQRLIAEAIEKVTNVPISKLGHRSRKREVVYARHIYCFQMRDKTTWSLKEIGASIGGRDHTTVINSVKVYHDLNETEDSFFELCNLIENEIDMASGDLYYIEENKEKDCITI